MILNKSKIKEICEKYGFHPKKCYGYEFTYPGMKTGDYAVCIPQLHNNYVNCAVDIIDCQKDYLSDLADSRIGFFDVQRVYSYVELENRLIFLKKRIIEFKKKIKLENIEKDF